LGGIPPNEQFVESINPFMMFKTLLR